MLADRAKIEVRAGAGGDGCSSFRREAHVPKGGPDGGDGGRGGDVVLVADDSLRDLQSFKRRAHYRADRGQHGRGSGMHGRGGGDLEVKVPPGTVVTLEDGTVFDLVAPGMRAVVARGGIGGRGNLRFKGPSRQAPRLAEKGLAGDESIVELHLKLLADVGLVGVPNAGKSSLLSVLTRAAPKVAGYPFTTLEPVLGTLDAGDRQVVVADIPGLIEGASTGAGLGHDFLAHVERCRLLVHVLDLAPLDGSDPIENHRVIEAELAQHSPALAALPRVLVLSKADLVPPEEAEAARAMWDEHLNGDGPALEPWETADPLARVPVLVCSSATRQGLDELAAELLRRVPVREAVEVPLGEVEAVAEHRVFRPATKRAFEVAREGDGTWVVKGEAVDRLLARFELDDEEALAYVESRLRSMGVIAALEARGFEPGDDVELGGLVFELHPGQRL